MMLLGVLGEYENIVDVDQDPSLSYHISEVIIHHGLECGGQVGHSKEHYCQFE